MIARLKCGVVLLGALVAAASASATVLITSRTISGVDAGWGGEGIYVYVNEAVSSAQTGFACASNRYYMPVGSPMYIENFAIILTAYKQGAKLDFAVVDCQLGAIRFSAVHMHK